jgi:hypothetical protein
VNQFFFLQPDVCAFIYALNEKKGTYCGFFHDISKTNNFKYEHFLAANMLPGPNSHVRCILQRDGMFGATELCSYEKQTNQS